MINWTVGSEDYKLKLTTKGAVSAEDRIGKNPLEVIQGDELPKLKDLLVILHEAINTYNHGVKLDTVYDLYDQWSEDHDFSDFIVFMVKLLQDGGFISKKIDLDEEIKNL